MARLLFTLPRFHTNMWFAVRQMLADGHEVSLLVNGSASGEDHSLLSPTVMGRHPSRSEVRNAIEAFGPDLVIVRNAWALSRRAARAARQMNVPMRLYNQLPVNQPTTLRRRLELRWKGLPVRRVTPVRGIDHNAKDDPFADYLPWPVGHLPHADPDGGTPGKLSVLLVGKLGAPRKNHDKLIAAIERTGAHEHIALTIVGSTPKAENEHFDKLQKLAAKPWIKLIGTLPFHEMPEVYAAHDICILPSFAEPLGTSPVEAMAYGTVPIISAQCGSAGYLTSGRDGFVFDPDDMTSAAEELKRLALDRTALNRLRDGALATYEAELSEAAFSARLDTLLSTFLPAA